MKTTVLFFLGISLPLFSGYILISFIEKEKKTFSGIEKFILSYSLGTGMLTVYMLYLGILGFPYVRHNFIPYFIVSFLFYLITFKKFRFSHKNFMIQAQHLRSSCRDFLGKFLVVATSFYSQEKTKKVPNSLGKKVMLAIIWSLLVFKLVFVVSHILYVPTYFDDAFAHWNYRAKIIFYEKSLNMDPESEIFLGGTHKIHYPLYIQLFKAYMMIAIGDWSEAIAKLISSLYAFFLLIMVYLNLKNLRLEFLRLLAIYLIASIPLFLIHAASNYADLTISFFFTSAGIYLCRWLESKNNAFLIVSACLLGIANFTKNEGIILYTPSFIITLLFFLVSQKKGLQEIIKQALVYISTTLIFCIGWLYINWKFGLGFDESGKSANLEFHPEAFSLLYDKLLFEGEYNLFWLGLCLLVIAGWKILKEPPLRYNFFLIGVVLFASLLPFVLTHNFQYLLNEMTIHRTMLIAIPFAIYSCGLLMDKLFSES